MLQRGCLRSAKSLKHSGFLASIFHVLPDGIFRKNSHTQNLLKQDPSFDSSNLPQWFGAFPTIPLTMVLSASMIGLIYTHTSLRVPSCLHLWGPTDSCPTRRPRLCPRVPSRPLPRIRRRIMTLCHVNVTPLHMHRETTSRQMPDAL